MSVPVLNIPGKPFPLTHGTFPAAVASPLQSFRAAAHAHTDSGRTLSKNTPSSQLRKQRLGRRATQDYITSNYLLNVKPSLGACV